MGGGRGGTQFTRERCPSLPGGRGDSGGSSGTLLGPGTRGQVRDSGQLIGWRNWPHFCRMPRFNHPGVHMWFQLKWHTHATQPQRMRESSEDSGWAQQIHVSCLTAHIDEFTAHCSIISNDSLQCSVHIIIALSATVAGSDLIRKAHRPTGSARCVHSHGASEVETKTTGLVSVVHSHIPSIP